MKKVFFAVVLIAVLFVLALPVFAQDDTEIPFFFEALFSTNMLAAVGVVVGFTKYLRNMVNIKGPFAVAITFVVAFVYAFIQYNSEGIPFVIGVAIASGLVGAGVFKGTKWVGKQVNPAGTS